MLRRACWLRCISFAAVSVRLPMVPLGTGHLDTLRAAVANDASVMSHCVKISGPPSCHSWEFWEQGDFYSGYQIQVFFFRVRQTVGFSTGPATDRIGWKFDREENIQAASHILIKVFYVRGDFLLPWLARAIQEDSSLPDLPVIHKYLFAEGQLHIDSNIPGDIMSLAIRELVSTSTHAMHLYSDVSSHHQDSITTRFAACSLVLDLAGHIQASNYSLTCNSPNTHCPPWFLLDVQESRTLTAQSF